jgi:hypothetical protein
MPGYRDRMNERNPDPADSADPARRAPFSDEGDTPGGGAGENSGRAAKGGVRGGRAGAGQRNGDRAAGGTKTRHEQADQPKSAARSASRSPTGEALSVADRSLIASVLGMPPAVAVGAAAACTAVGVALDLLRTGTLGTVFTICYLAGCVLAAVWVRRSGLFWPMVTPPLLMAVTVAVVVLVAGTTKPGAGVAQRLLVIGAPLVNGFPMMAWTTGLVLALGVVRLLTQRLNPRPRGKDATRAGERMAGERRSASPGRR